MMPKQLMTAERALALLRETPRRIAAATEGLDSRQLREPPAPGEWSANDVLAHLRACADARGGPILRMLEADHPTLRAVNPRTWLEQTSYPEEAFRQSLRAFTTQRQELVAALVALPAEGWSRSATVTGAGAPLERTVLFYADWLARHERPHVKQVEATAAALARR